MTELRIRSVVPQGNVIKLSYGACFFATKTQNTKKKTKIKYQQFCVLVFLWHIILNLMTLPAGNFCG